MNFRLFVQSTQAANKKTRRQTLAAGSWNSRCGFYYAYISHQTTQPPTLTPHQHQAALIVQML